MMMGMNCDIIEDDDGGSSSCDGDILVLSVFGDVTDDAGGSGEESSWIRLLSEHIFIKPLHRTASVKIWLFPEEL